MVNGKVVMVLLIAGLIKKLIKKYFPKPKCLEGKVKVELD